MTAIKSTERTRPFLLRRTMYSEWERYTDILDNFDVDLFTLGLTFYLY